MDGHVFTDLFLQLKINHPFHKQIYFFRKNLLSNVITQKEKQEKENLNTIY